MKQMNVFDWDRLANEQGHFPERMTTNVWFQSHFSHRLSTYEKQIQGLLLRFPWTMKGEISRVIFELSDERKPLASAHAVWMKTLNVNEIQEAKLDF